MTSYPTTSFVAVAHVLIKDAETLVKTGQRSPTLLRDYNQRLNAYCLPYFGKTLARDINTRKLRDFQTYLATQGLSGSTIRCVLSFVSKVLHLAAEEGHIPAVPKIPRPQHRDCPRPAFREAEYKVLLEKLREIEAGKHEVEFKGTKVDWELRAMVTFMLNAFLRPGDLFTLKHCHVEICGRAGDEYLRLTPPASKGHNDPIITMPTAVAIYRRVVAKRGSGGVKPNDYVFMPDRPNRDYAKEIVRRLFMQVLQVAGIKQTSGGVPHSLYSLRHTAITMRLLKSDGLDLLTLARTCRTSVEMIDRFYARSLTAEMNREKLQSFRKPTRYAA